MRTLRLFVAASLIAAAFPTHAANTIRQRVPTAHLDFATASSLPDGSPFQPWAGTPLDGANARLELAPWEAAEHEIAWVDSDAVAAKWPGGDIGLHIARLASAGNESETARPYGPPVAGLHDAFVFDRELPFGLSSRICGDPGNGHPSGPGPHGPIAPVPEPSGYAMAAVGILLIGALQRRRARSSPPVA